MSSLRSALGVLFALVAAACASVGPDYAEPRLDLAERWSEPAGEGLVAQPAELDQWWGQLGDPLLATLVERALTQGLDVRAALARLEEARALRGAARADRLPSIGARASYEHREESENTPLGAFVPRSDIHAAGLDAAWEIDLWGRVRRLVEAAERDLEASLEDVQDVALTVAAETALAYVDLRAFERRLAIARTNVELQERTLALVTSRFEAGLVGERDIAQAATNVESTRSRVPLLEGGSRAAQVRLAVLLGVAPGTLSEELSAPAAVPRPPLSLAVGVPADLLRRRPDVRRAERAFAAEVARVGVAQGDRFPRLDLAGTLGLASDGIGHFLEQDSTVVGFGPSLRWSLFDAGRLRQRVRAQSARAEQRQIDWERTVLLALEEAENAMTGFVREQARRSSLERAATQARRAVELARTQYREGLSDFQAVLDSERVVAGLEDELVLGDAAVTIRAIALYKALGGGFDGEHSLTTSAISSASVQASAAGR